MKWICNATPDDWKKIQRLRQYGMCLTAGRPKSTPGFTHTENARAGLIGIYDTTSEEGK